MESNPAPLRSPNFQFLKSLNPLLVELGARAESYALSDPNTAMMKVRQMGELLAQGIAANCGVSTMDAGRPKSQRDLLRDLERYMQPEISSLMHEIRKEGNEANHNINGNQGRAVTLLRHFRNAAVWAFKTFHNRNLKAGPFVPPVASEELAEDSRKELERVNKLYQEAAAKARSLEDQYAGEVELRKYAEEEQARAYKDLEAAMELTEEETERLNQQVEDYRNQLEELSAQTTLSQETREKIRQVGEAVAQEELTEDDTREIIDMHLRQAGWIVDSQEMRHAKGTRPQRGKNTAIAEWPTETGPADYVLFIGLMPVAVVEAKRKRVDVASAIEQAKRYSRGFDMEANMESPDGPWQEQYRIPFMFSSNGREYLKQLRTKSGVWFFDSRRSENLSRPLDGWYSPEGLKQLLRQDIDEATESLGAESADYLPLRYYQRDAIAAAEKGIAEGRRELLIAMATGTGKTRTCICLCYRLLKAGRFRRILFLVDRTSLGEQATDSFKDVKLERQQGFGDIYDIKELGDIKPDDDTRLHVATVQGMVARVLESDTPPCVDDYDCIVVDECHRGYTLDQEMSESEMQFRSEQDYISKYMRVLDHFDAVKIGLTATPAMHTLSLFGGERRKPIYQYSYRKAVIDNFLVDHEPPFRAITEKTEEGITFTAGEDIPVLNTRTDEVELSKVQDEVTFEVEDFNRTVITPGFNRAICEGLASKIDPREPGKTLIFCVTDDHADDVVDTLKQEFKKRYKKGITDDMVRKITGASDKPLEQIRYFKNEKMPSVAVTVDLLTTGIDVPAIINLVFLRRTRSRILYEQMIGRATRKCDDLHGEGRHKDRFYIYDCVDLYSGLMEHSSMKPVVARPSLDFKQLSRELLEIKADFAEEVKVQFLGKISRKLAKANNSQRKQVEYRGSIPADDLVATLEAMTPQSVGEWAAEHPALITYLDKTPFGDAPRTPIDSSPDRFKEWGRGYGESERPEDYLETFKQYIENNLNDIIALQIVTQRPRDLTRSQLKELKLKLDSDGFNETKLQSAYEETTNKKIAASIIGFVRNVMLDTPLMDYQQRVDQAMELIIASRDWKPEQTKWLRRIGKQLREETIVDRDCFDTAEFRRKGGFNRINKAFDGKLEEVLREIADAIWATAA